MPRLLAALSASTLAAVALAGCTVETQTCKNGVCTIKLKGANSSGTLGGDGGSKITLLSTTDDSAKVKLGANTGVLKVHEPIQLSNATLELTEVKGSNSIVLKLRASGPPRTAGCAVCNVLTRPLG
ncbi:MAG: hypothetical protein AAGC46_10125 [Solirubrobacteraceae bacterium]|nr:hypothetical protein [Patulibacter sp.]